QTCCLGRCMCFQPGVFGKGCAGFLRLGQAQFGCRCDADTIGCQQITDFLKFALIMRGDQQPITVETTCHAMAAFCAATRSAIPLSARSSSSFISSREKVAPSADI